MMHLYSVDETARRLLTQPEVPVVPVSIPNPKGMGEVVLQSRGCWADPNNARIMPDVRPTGWDLTGCAWEAAKAGRKVFGMEAGGQCWIPNSSDETAETVAARSPLLQKPATAWKELGEGNMMHLYSIDETARQQLVHPVPPTEPREIQNQMKPGARSLTARPLPFREHHARLARVLGRSQQRTHYAGSPAHRLAVARLCRGGGETGPLGVRLRGRR